MLRRLLSVALLVLVMSTPSFAAGSSSWQVLEYENNGLPIVMKVMENLPPKSFRSRFGWLTVISWHYDAAENNGMPVPDMNDLMIRLESAIDLVQEEELCVQVYSKTGDGLKELVYYIRDRDEFMKAFNEVLDGHPRYPLDIKFFEDSEWSDLRTAHKVYLGNE